jgi:hypothetical protein
MMFWGGCLAAAAAIAMVPVLDPVAMWVVLSAALGFTVGMVMALPAIAGWIQDTTGSIAYVIWFSAACLAIAPFSILAFRVLQRRWALGVSGS